ncbi:uncharacterized protein LOC127869088 [Dreissena polymorpha]|uniref:Uncharacterized protein n=1 Tax=Dreissena polymorpha TaxID=45954 RepID=A0A9D4MDP6_DREPO|nr:uncharacterized protein LOC127869088 [Dreissena polymorpha]KAH3873789.1 hypothetical protein DPMN_037029 [Dreissena polymorpha]
MSIVLPKRKKKKDFFVPRKSFQEVKEAIGPAFFDPTLLECSKNVAELTKLTHRYEDIDKERKTVIREIDREKRILMRSVKHTFSSSRKDVTKSQQQRNIDLIETKQGIETLDGRQVTPGFRYTSCGNIKPSTMSLPLCHMDSDSDNETDENQRAAEWRNMLAYDTSRASHPTLKVAYSYKNVSDYESIDYDQEIKNLKMAIDELCQELEKSKLNPSDKTPSNQDGKIRPFLRAHTTDYHSENYLTVLQIPDRRNSLQKRSPHLKHSKGDLYRRAVSTPSHRSCVGCQFRLKEQFDLTFSDQVRKFDEAKNVLKRKWSYVPHGKYVHSSTIMASQTTLAKSSSSLPSTSNRSFHQKRTTHAAPLHDEADEIIDTNGRRSVVHFNTEHNNVRENNKSSKLNNGQPRMYAKSASDVNYWDRPTTTRSNTRTESAQTGSTVLEMRAGLSLDSAISGRSSGRMTSRNASRMLIDYDSRLEILKELQVENDKLCDMRVKSFLSTIQPPQKQR